MFENLPIRLLVMQVTVMEVVNVPVVFNGRVATIGAMLMIVALVGCRHEYSLSLK